MAGTPIAYIDATGIHKPAFQDVWNYYQNRAKSICGADIYIDPDSQDGEFLGIFSSSVDDGNAMAVQCYNSFSPATAQGTGLSSVVKINNIQRLIPSFSTAVVTVVGQAGTQISSGVVQDANGISWNLPSLVLIPLSGQIDVTVTCATIGAVTAAAGEISVITTPTLGWQSVFNVLPATAGLPVEKDGPLKIRQANSTMIASKSIFDGLLGAIAAIPDVARYRGYENDTSQTNSFSIPASSIAIVTDGGNSQSIVNTIGLKKPPAIPTYGTNSGIYTDAYGIPKTIYYSQAAPVNITWQVSVTQLAGYTIDVSGAIKQALVDWTNAVGIGNPVERVLAYLPAQLYGAASSSLYKLTDLRVARDGNTLALSDLTIAYNEVPFCQTSFVNVIVS